MFLLMGLLVIGGGFVVFRFFNPPGRLPDEINFICVETGKTYWIDRYKLVQVPAPNPETGELTLLPCTERDGQLYLDPHYAPSLERFGERNKYVDPETLAIRTR